MLQLTLDKTAFDSLDEVVKKFYIPDGEGYALDADVGALKRAKDHEVNARKALATENAQLKSRLAAVEAIDVEKAKGEVFDKFAQKHIKSEAERIAEKLAGSDNAKKLYPYIVGRLKVTQDMQTIGHDQNGKPFESLDAFVDSFLTDAVFSGIVKKSSQGSALNVAAKNPVDKKPVSSMTPKELAEYIKSKRGN